MEQEITVSNPLVRLFEDLDATDLSQGACSRRVQGLIYRIHQKKNEPYDLKAAIIGDPVSGVLRAEKVFQLAPYKDWMLLATENGQPGEVRQQILFAKPNLQGKLEAIPVFTFLERANDDGCSVSLFEPAVIDDLGWATVATSADEGKPVTIDESLKDIPQTNAKVLDTLIKILDNQPLDTINLEETLHLNELFKRAFPPHAEVIQEFASLNRETRHERLAREMGKIGVWSTLSGRPIVFKASIGKGELLQFSQLDERVAAVERIITNRGTSPKASRLGHMVVTDESQPLFVPETELESLFDKQATEEILKRAEEAYDIPETISSLELTKSINDMIADLVSHVPRAEHAKKFNEQLSELIRDWRQKSGNIDHSSKERVLQLGDIDLRRLGSGTYFNGSCNFTTAMGTKMISPFYEKISAHIIANDSQSVFKEYEYKLYDCSVQGAQEAFISTMGGKKLLAKACVYAFGNNSNLGEFSDSIALNVKKAFYNSNISASHCIAQNCYNAFERIAARDSIALNCEYAFTLLSEASRDLTAEFCEGGKKLFTEKYSNILGNYVRIGRSERARRNLVAKNITGGLFGSIPSNYGAGKRFGKRPDIRK